MRKDRSIYIVAGLFALLLSACAQVGTISGGDRDEHAPKPNYEKAEPQPNTTFFSGKEVTIPFDEFFSLNNPAQNIFIIPPHATLDARYKGKDLIISWEEELEPNTTYSIYIDKAIKDITEGNDSTMQFVFSTGAVIDSLSYRAFLSDAWTGKPMNEATLAFYDGDKLINFGRSDASGKVELNYMKAGNYKAVAFIDENLNLEWDSTEVVGFKSDMTIGLTSEQADSVPYQLFTPVPKPRITTVQFQSPGRIVLGANVSLKNSAVYFNDVLLPKEQIQMLGRDSIVCFVNTNELSGLQKVRIESEELKSEKNIRIPTSQQAITIRSLNRARKVAPSESLRFELSDLIRSVDTNHIHLYNSQDSTEINDFQVSFDINQLSVNLDKSKYESVLFVLDSAVVNCLNGTLGSFETTLTLADESEYGSILVDASAYNEPILLDLLGGDKLIERRVLNNESEVLFEELEPGVYTFRVIHDENENAIWDVGDVELLRQQEKIDRFSKPNKVRPNWQINVSLIPNE